VHDARRPHHYGAFFALILALMVADVLCSIDVVLQTRTRERQQTRDRQ
jgi:hypothetical protein